MPAEGQRTSRRASREQPGPVADGSIHTFLFADLAGYSALTEAHGDVGAADAAADFFAEVGRLRCVFGGEEVKTLGDAVMVRIDSPDNAVRLGAAIAAEVGHRHRALGVRTGLHSGTAVRRGADWFGATVNLAARVAADASRGELLCTEATRALAGAALEGRVVRTLGPRRFKNIAEPVLVHAIDAQPAANASWTVDPVCRMVLSRDELHVWRLHGEDRVHFCSELCAEAFEAAPAHHPLVR